MNKLRLAFILCCASLCTDIQADDDTYIYATVYAEQDMTATAEVPERITVLTIDASAISGTVTSVSVYANSKTSIVGTYKYDGSYGLSKATVEVPSVYAASAKSDVVTAFGNNKICNVYLLPVALTGGVKVTVRTDDGNFYTQNFTDNIAAGTHQTLTITNTTASQLWMSTLPGSLYFSMLSTPGAHDAATSTISAGWGGMLTSYYKTQSDDIATQLLNGVRCFDLRPGYKYKTTITASNLYIYHGDSSTGVLYVNAIKTLVDFLKQNPSETITVTMVKESGSGDDRSSEMWSVINACHSEYSAYMKLLDHSYYTLDDFRGKICYINRNGTSCTNTTQITNWPDDGSLTDYSAKIGNVCYANIQDAYNTNGSDKVTAIKTMLGYSSSNTQKARFHFNFCSSAYTTSNVLKKPSDYASSTNPAITTYLNDGNISGPTGYLFADFIGSSSNGGADLLRAIINQNYRYAYYGRSVAGVPVTYGLLGDVDGNKSLSIADLSLLISIINGTDTATSAADVNLDGVVNKDDITVVNRLLLER